MNAKFKYALPVWKQAPFLRLLLPLMIGILLQWYLQLNFSIIVLSLVISSTLFFAYNYLPLFTKFRFGFLSGLLVNIIFISLGCIITSVQDIRTYKNGLLQNYKQANFVIATLQEQPIEKAKSFKAEANVVLTDSTGKQNNVEGKIIIYFEKDSSINKLVYGSKIIFKNNLQKVTNAGNPAEFDFQRYCYFNKISHQVYLKKRQFQLLTTQEKKIFQQSLIDVRNWVVGVMQKYISGKKEQGLAEAMLIGYKDDLDKNLVQSYTNTGVVHIIAISGMHLGLIYLLLKWMLIPFRRNKKRLWQSGLIIILGLWFFSFIAGAGASIVRSAVMFTFIVIGDSFNRKASIYNTLAASAFFLLCYNPFWLWDVGFQLSYAAVLSIVIFMKPIYSLLFFKNKIADFIWQMNAVSFAAQILTFPVSIFHFHQFPNLFFITNLVAVPVSTLLIYGMIILCVFALIPLLAMLWGIVLHYCIFWLNSYIEWVEKLPYSLWDGLQINFIQTLLLYISIIGFSFLLLEKRKFGICLAFSSLFLFGVIRFIDFYKTNQQEKIIVYNVPGKLAIDFIEGNKFISRCDSSLQNNDFGKNFYLKPSRIFLRTYKGEYRNNIADSIRAFRFASKNIVVLNSQQYLDSTCALSKIDLLIVNGKIALNSKHWSVNNHPQQIVFCGNSPSKKFIMLKNFCDSLKIKYHLLFESGAYVSNVNDESHRYKIL